MFSPEEIRHITFTQVGRNKYSADEVDDFVDGRAFGKRKACSGAGKGRDGR